MNLVAVAIAEIGQDLDQSSRSQVVTQVHITQTGQADAGQHHAANGFAIIGKELSREHAVERFRERVDEEFTARSDNDLKNLLDDRIQHAERMVKVIDHKDGGTLKHVFYIQNRNGKTNLAVVVIDQSRVGRCVTVLDENMFDQNILNKSWTLPAEKLENRPFESLSVVTTVPNPSSSTPSFTPGPTQRDLEAAAIRHANALRKETMLARHILGLEDALAEAKRELESAKDESARAWHELDQIINSPAPTKEK